MSNNIDLSTNSDFHTVSKRRSSYSRKNQAAFITIFAILFLSSLRFSCHALTSEGNPIKKMRISYREMTPLAGEPEKVAGIKNLSICADNPQREIPVRIYFPLADSISTALLPVFLFTHGGGFVSGDLDTHDVLLRSISNGAKCIVVSVGYRLAPEHPFPAGLEDAYAILLWLKKNVTGLGGDAVRIAVGGDSAGGNLAASLCILARERQEPGIIGLPYA